MLVAATASSPRFRKRAFSSFSSFSSLSLDAGTRRIISMDRSKSTGARSQGTLAGFPEAPLSTNLERVLRRRVYVGDDDASGLIYFASYFRYMAEGDQEYFCALGKPVWDQIAAGEGAPAVHASCDFFLPVRTGDGLLQRVRLVPGGRSSFSTGHVFENEDGRAVAKGEIVRVWTNLATLESQPYPQWIGNGGAAQVDPGAGTTSEPK